MNPGDHEASKFKAAFQESLQALGKNKIRVLYLHIPDRTVPFENTLEAVNDLYQAGHLYVPCFPKSHVHALTQVV